MRGGMLARWRSIGRGLQWVLMGAAYLVVAFILVWMFGLPAWIVASQAVKENQYQTADQQALNDLIQSAGLDPAQGFVQLDRRLSRSMGGDYVAHRCFQTSGLHPRPGHEHRWQLVTNADPHLAEAVRSAEQLSSSEHCRRRDRTSHEGLQMLARDVEAPEGIIRRATFFLYDPETQRLHYVSYRM